MSYSARGRIVYDVINDVLWTPLESNNHQYLHNLTVPILPKI